MIRRFLIMAVMTVLFCSPLLAEEAGMSAGVNTDGDLTACFKSVKKPGIKSPKTEECQQAAEYYRKAIEERPDLAENYLMMARCFGFMGQFDMALPYNDKAIELAPQDWTAHMDKAMNYVALKRFKEAGPELRKALDLLKSLNGKATDIQMVEDMIKKYSGKL